MHTPVTVFIHHITNYAKSISHSCRGRLCKMSGTNINLRMPNTGIACLCSGCYVSPEAHPLGAKPCFTPCSCKGGWEHVTDTPDQSTVHMTRCPAEQQVPASVGRVPQLAAVALQDAAHALAHVQGRRSVPSAAEGPPAPHGAPQQAAQRAVERALHGCSAVRVVVQRGRDVRLPDDQPRPLARRRRPLVLQPLRAARANSSSSGVLPDCLTAVTASPYHSLIHHMGPSWCVPVNMVMARIRGVRQGPWERDPCRLSY